MTRGQITHRIFTNGGGNLTLADLEAFITRAKQFDAPDGATVTATTHSDQRESGWTISVTWSDGGQK